MLAVASIDADEKLNSAGVAADAKLVASSAVSHRACVAVFSLASCRILNSFRCSGADCHAACMPRAASDVTKTTSHRTARYTND